MPRVIILKPRVSPRQLEFEGENDGEDRISKLPDEILIQFLSLLPIREVMCTSILSRRWRHMWTHTSNLNFDATKIIHELQRGNRGRGQFIESQNYVNMVNHVMNSNQAPQVDLLRIHFYLSTRQFDHHINEWVDFSVNKKVKSLEIDLSHELFYNRIYPHPLEQTGFKSLEELKLVFLDVTGECLEGILATCPKLERLTVSGSMSLVDLKVTGPSLQLKHLEILNCPEIENVEIYAENLKTMKYSGRVIRLKVLRNTPRLTEFYVGDVYCKFFIDQIEHFSSHISRIETIGLDMFEIQKITDFRHFPELSNLKQLDVKLKANDEESLLGLISLLKVCPFLQKFILRLKCWRSRPIDRKVKEAEKFRHPRLKFVELYGFIGLAIDIELATYFLENVVSLEYITINCGYTWFPESSWNANEDDEAKITARKKARLLGQRLLPRGVTMQIN